MKHFRIVCVGDSLTGPSPGESYLDKYIKWSDLLELALESAIGKNRIEVINQGKAGDTAAGVRQHIHERLLQWQPTLAIILIGANDFAADQAADAGDVEISRRYRENLKQIVVCAKSAGILVLLLQYPDPRAQDMQRVWTHANRGNLIVTEVGREEGVPVLNLKPEFDAAAQRQSLACLTSPVDGVHLNPGGELVLTRSVIDKLRALGWIPSPVAQQARKE